MSTDATSGKAKRRRLGKGLSGMIGGPVQVEQTQADTPTPTPSQSAADPSPRSEERV